MGSATADLSAAGGAEVGFLSQRSALCARLLTAPGAAGADDATAIHRIADAYLELLAGPGAEMVSTGELLAVLDSGRFFELAEGSSARDHLRDGLHTLEEIARTAVRDEAALMTELRERLAARISELARAEVVRADAREKAAVETVETSTGAVFTRVRHSKFGLVWRDPSGMVWSKPVPGRFNNAGRVENGLVVDSEATRACAELGGRLPTKEEFERLRSYFELGSKQMFTDSGRAEFHGIFPEMKNTWFWSSSVGKYYDYDFFGFDGIIGFGYRDNVKHDAVLCVAGR